MVVIYHLFYHEIVFLKHGKIQSFLKREGAHGFPKLKKNRVYVMRICNVVFIACKVFVTVIELP